MSPLAWMPKKLKGFLPTEGLLAYRHMGASCIYSNCLNNWRGSFIIYLFLCPQPSAVSDGTINVCLQGAATMFVNKSHTRGTSNGPPATTRMIRISVKSNSAGFAASPLFRSVHLCFFLLFAVFIWSVFSFLSNRRRDWWIQVRVLVNESQSSCSRQVGDKCLYLYSSLFPRQTM